MPIPPPKHDDAEAGCALAATPGSLRSLSQLPTLMTSVHRKLEERVVAAIEEHRLALQEATAALLCTPAEGDSAPDEGEAPTEQPRKELVMLPAPASRSFQKEEPSPGGADNDRSLASPQSSQGMRSASPKSPGARRQEAQSEDTHSTTRSPASPTGGPRRMPSALQRHATMVMATSVHSSLENIRAARLSIMNRLYEEEEIVMSGCTYTSLRFRATRIKDARSFEVFIAIAILANAACIGWDVDWKITNPKADTPQSLIVADFVFISVFSLELLLRLFVEGWTFFYLSNQAVGWNLFDTLLIVLAIVDLASPFNLNLTMLRVCRVLRLARVLRFIRLLKSFRELRVIVSGILNCGKTLLWSFLILLAVSYVYCVFFLQLCSDWLADRSDALAERSDKEQDIVEFLDKHFSSLIWSMYTLWKALLGGITWGELSDPLLDVNVVLLVTFPLYIGVTVLVILNIVTASFVQAASRTRGEEDAKFLELLEDKEAWIQKIRQVFSRVDQGDTNTLTWAQFQKLADDFQTQVLFSEIGLDLDDYHGAKTLFDLFDIDGDGQIDMNEFVQGIAVYRGHAKSVDMSRNFQRLQKRLDELKAFNLASPSSSQFRPALETR